MKRTSIFAAAALALAAMGMNGGAAMAQVQAPSAKSPTVAIGADGIAEAAPDKAVITLGLITNDPSSEAAAAKNNRDFAKIIMVAKESGIGAIDLRTAGVNVRPKYNYSADGGESLDGYVASNSVTITMRDLAKIGKLLADLTAAGANSVSGPFFGLEDNEVLRDKARENAFDNAERRALSYARKAGFKSVRLLTINENAGDMLYGAAAFAAADAAAAAGDAASAAKMAIVDAFIEPGLVTETVYANFLFEMVP